LGYERKLPLTATGDVKARAINWHEAHSQLQTTVNLAHMKIQVVEKSVYVCLLVADETVLALQHGLSKNAVVVRYLIGSHLPGVLTCDAWGFDVDVDVDVFWALNVGGFNIKKVGGS
jgi:hypothetical protein